MNALVQSFRDLNQLKLAAMVGTAVVMIGFFAFLSLRVTAPNMSPLFASVSLDDGAKIVAELDKENVKYELRAGGTQVLVPADMVDKLRLTMAQLGLPGAGAGIGYEIFDKSSALGTPNFVLNINQVRALEGELARTIQGFDSVDAARVHLVMPTHELFARETSEPTASVAVKLRGAAGLSKNEVAAIRHLVATAVPGLKPQRVTIVDSHGTLLAKGQDRNSDPNAVSEESDAYRVEYETRMGSTIERLLEQSVGPNKVKAEVHADIDFDRIVTNREKYDPDGQVARSTQSVTDNEKAADSSGSGNSTVSASNNLPGGTNSTSAQGGSSSNRTRTEETTNYEINKEVTNSIKESGNVKKLSVAVLVDGVYTTDKDGKQQYGARSPEELKKIEDLVKSSIGFDANRGDTVSVVNMQFANNDLNTFTTGPFDWIKQDLNSIIQTLVLGGVAILSILLVVRPLVSRVLESMEITSKENELEQAALAAPSITARLMDQSKLAAVIEEPEEEEDMINIDRIQGKLKSSTYTKINNMVDKHPTETSQILKAWLSGM